VDDPALRELGERIRALVASSIVRHAGLGIAVRVSIGGAMAERGDGAQDLLARADAALYRAKSGGRDRVAMA
jgi:GGDEF domain-containing protein